jgi:SAM-dependent methyltransferase
VAIHSNSQRTGMSGEKRASFLIQLAAMHMRRMMSKGGFTHIAADLEAYRDAYALYSGKDLSEGRSIIELGYGQRPFRMITLQSLGYDVVGIDLDASLYRLTPSNIATLIRTNGLLRAAKSIARRVVFDGSDYRKLDSYLRSTFGKPLRFDAASLMTGDLGDPAVWTQTGRMFDLIYSEDVFEHIPPDVLPNVIENIGNFLAPGGVAIVTPMVFTGIAGAHDIEWFPHRVGWTNTKRGPAWGHLTGEALTESDTYLNQLTRNDYRKLFSIRFDILQETTMLGRLGAQHLTPERRVRLGVYEDDELFSNSVRFVLTKRDASTADAAL